MANTGGKRSCWPDMLAELLELVLRRLARRDYLKCRLVCRRWRSIVNGAIKNKCPPAPQIPSLLLLPPSHLYNDTILFDITHKDFRRLEIPNNVRTVEKLLCILRSEEEGWLMCQSVCNLLWIFNPVSGENYKLPALPAGQKDQNRITIPCIRVAFSSQSMLVVISLCYEVESTRQLFFCRVDYDKSWTRIETNESHSEFKDIMLLGWKLYSMNRDSMTIFNLGELNAITAERFVMQLPKLDDDGERVNTCRLARDSTSGEVLLVLFRSNCMNHVKDFLIFKLDMSGPRWIEVHSLGGRVLFVDGSGVRVISTAYLNARPEFIGGGGNCVYFSLCQLMKPYLGVFFLKDKTIQPLDNSIIKSYSAAKTMDRSLWFTPRPW